MFKQISGNILTGLVTILPIVLTLYFLYWLAVSAESLLGGVFRWFVPDFLYVPGMGLLAGLALLFMIGLLMHAYVFQRLFAKAESLLFHMPVIKTVYRAIRDFFDYFSASKNKEFEHVVAVTLGNTDMEVIGFMTQTNSEEMPKDFGKDAHVLVYLPMSYMIGGYSVLLPRSSVRPLPISMEEAMRFTLTAGVAGKS